MLLTSPSFFVFFLAYCIAYFLIKPRFRWIVILFGSLYFYLSLKPEYFFIIIAVIFFNYLMGLFIGGRISQVGAKSLSAKADSGREMQKAVASGVSSIRIGSKSLLSKSDSAQSNEGYSVKFSSKALTVFGVLINIIYLSAFKYLNFIGQALKEALSIISISFTPMEYNILLPVGISFYTFQNISYLIGIYQKRYHPEKNIGIFAAYILFFPKLLSGPIERASNFIPQLKKENKFEYSSLVYGIERIVWGLFLKLAVADRLALVVNAVYSNPTHFNGTYLIIATVFFAFQVYTDLAGYTSIAIGSARIMGYSLTENFRRPYLAKNVAEFWRRWHISLSSWFQDYVFVPLYLRISKLKAIASLKSKNKHTVSFIASILIGEVLLGLWHGANWNFIAFGAFYGITITAYYLTRRYWDKMNSIIQIVLTFILVNVGFIFFRVNNLSDAAYILTNLLVIDKIQITKEIIGLDIADFIISITLILSVIIFDILQETKGIRNLFNKIPRYVRWIIRILLVLGVLLLGVFQNKSFIYVQF